MLRKGIMLSPRACLKKLMQKPIIKGSGAWENSNFGLKTDFLRYYHILTATCVYYCQANDECNQTNFDR